MVFNVGQIIQTVIALSALVISGVMAWPQLKGNNLLTGGAIIFYLMVGLVLVSAGLVISSVRSSSAPPTLTPSPGSQPPTAPTPSPGSQSPAPTPSSGLFSDRLVFGPPIVPTVAVDTTNESETSTSFPGDLTVITFKRSVGDFWQFPNRDITIEVRSVRENTQKRYDEDRVRCRVVCKRRGRLSVRRGEGDTDIHELLLLGTGKIPK
jgi:hypothetical protein